MKHRMRCDPKPKNKKVSYNLSTSKMFTICKFETVDHVETVDNVDKLGQAVHAIHAIHVIHEF